ncbi:hypothetical protein PR048_021059 [Dryococelus australis]|uniref:Uncharacterized protein n=1 Tax=Dryococelus australis TaxID=614101 RepID=A0ABQ9GX87_9NEOP|nr:hypothetical protein PR048_021059 [Dryococelus australis]
MYDIYDGSDSLTQITGSVPIHLLRLHRFCSSFPQALLQMRTLTTTKLLLRGKKPLINIITGGNFSDVKIKRSYKVKPLAIMRRKHRSNALVLKLRDVSNENVSVDCKVVVDRGHLLNSLVWPRRSTFGQIHETYVTFIEKLFSLTATVVSDGYTMCTNKGEKPRERFAGRSYADIQIATNNVVDFVRIYHSKNGFIKLLVTYFRASVHRAIQCSEDAGTTIAGVALEHYAICGARVIATDKDMPVMSTARADEDTHIEVLHPSSGKNTGKIFNISAIQRDVGGMKNYILFCRTNAGSDATSAFFGKGKKKAWNIFTSNVSIQSTVDVFMHPNADKRDYSAEEKFTMSLYQGHASYATLDELKVYT